MTDDRDLEAAIGRVLTAKESGADSVARIAQRFDSALPPQKRAFAGWPAALTDWNFAPAWPRIVALACAAVLGITVGLSSLGTRLAADLDLVRVASADDGGSNAFDVDSVTGIRP
jgi:anti-sigma-K factor RskA